MRTESKRLFINNLESKVSEEDLRAKFSNYGNVTSVEIKERKNPVGTQTEHFAYVNINADDQSLHNCIEEFANRKWKGQFINLQVAKESFIDRLKREREEKEVKDPRPMVNGTTTIKPININISKYQNRRPQNVNNETTSTNNETSTVKNYNQDNEKRLKSLKQMKEGYRQQKLQIKNALSNIDKSKSANKIRFDFIPDGGSKNLKRRAASNNRNKRQLFDEEEDGNDFDFIVQNQFDGVKGQKLMQLQSRFRNDDRFKMDERFLEHDDEEGPEQRSELPENEQDKQFEILESVLGQKLKRPSHTKEVIEKKKSKMMLRFDPSQPEHSKFEVQHETVKEVKSRKREKRVPVAVVEEAPPPEVSKETFFKVTADLKSALHENEGFSLSKLFGNQIEQELEKDAQEYKLKLIDKKKHVGPDKRVFKYDSSDDENEGDGDEAERKTVTLEASQSKTAALQIKPRMWTETLFFKDDDYRLQEGFDFIKRLQLGEQKNFKDVRRNLKEIVRAKVKNNLRKNAPFKRKLGGNKKRIKVKRALKR